MIYELKQHPEYFEEVISGRKLFEVRKNDRDYKVGDLLALNEYNPESKEYTNRSCVVYIDYILNDPNYCKEGYVILSIKPCVVMKKYSPHCEAKFEFDYSVPMIQTTNPMGRNSK